MAEKSNIQWTDATWNIARGCTKVDSDCLFCYMYRDSYNDTRYNPKNVIRTKTVFNLPLRLKISESKCWNGRPLIFTSSLTDFFHKEIDPYREEAWDIIRKCPQFIFQILTKRPERIKDHLPQDWGEGWDNVWLGTSVGNNGAMHRISDLVDIKCKTRFVSFEPLHERLNLSKLNHATLLNNIDWAIIGGESGNDKGLYKYRPCEVEWIMDMMGTLQNAGCAVFVKQLGTHLSKVLKLNDRHGGDILEWQNELQVRNFPAVS